METIESTLNTAPVIPVVNLADAGQARFLAAALRAGGLNSIEITLRSNAALDAIKAISDDSEFDQMQLGAGTVLNVAQCKHALDAGARFIVSPGMDQKVVRHCLDNNVPVFPGAVTATEIQRASNLGLNVVKFFPAEASGGVAMLKALSAPFHQMRFIPTGGINAENMLDYLSLPSTLAVGGSWMVKPELFANHDFSQVESLARIAIAKLERRV